MYSFRAPASAKSTPIGATLQMLPESSSSNALASVSCCSALLLDS